jgi:hypothetical protein
VSEKTTKSASLSLGSATLSVLHPTHPVLPSKSHLFSLLECVKCTKGLCCRFHKYLSQVRALWRTQKVLRGNSWHQATPGHNSSNFNIWRYTRLPVNISWGNKLCQAENEIKMENGSL